MREIFTGIVEEIGTVEEIRWGANSCEVTIMAQIILKDVNVGDSIAVNGICLTVTTFSATSFTVDVMPETLRKTSLRHLRSGGRVNLERALQVGGRLGGHFVSGHIDGVGKIVALTQEDNALLITIDAPLQVMRYIISKGSVAIDGTSLTVVTCRENSFVISLIPHTRSVTILGTKRVGEQVNLEGDMIGKYVENLLHVKQEDHLKASGLSMEKLVDSGFL